MPNLSYIISTKPKVVPVVSTRYVGAGRTATLAVKTNNTTWGWGLNNNGMLGTNDTNITFTPRSVSGTQKSFNQIENSYLTTYAIDNSGQGWSWGYGVFGQLGVNSTASYRTPVAICGGHTFCKIYAGQYHGIALDVNGQVWCWGYNTSGQIGDNTVISKRTPVSILGATKTFCRISSGYLYNLAIDKNGRAWSWGLNNVGTLGDNTTTSRRTPVSVAGTNKTFCEISAADQHSLAIDVHGQCWAWGTNGYGKTGLNTVVGSVRTPTQVCGGHTFCKISAGAQHSLGLDYNGQLWAWGGNYRGELGTDGTIGNYVTPLAVCGPHTFCKISAGYNTSLAIDNNGVLWGWGQYLYGQLDNNLIYITPISIAGNAKTFCKITSYGSFILAYDNTNLTWGWGLNNLGQLATNNYTCYETPVTIYSNYSFNELSAGLTHGAGTDSLGRAFTWGNNNRGQIGDNTTSVRRTPVRVCGTQSFCKISAGNSYTVAIDNNGLTWGWGYNNYGQLGDNTIISKRTPVSILGTTKTFCKIAAGNTHTLAIDYNGRAWGWGFNSSRQLGDTTNVSKRTPVSVAGTIKTFCSIFASGASSLALDNNGQAWTWGNNSFGILGINVSYGSRCTPVAVCGNHTFCKIATGGGSEHMFALDYLGRAWSWGKNDYGQLGTGDFSPSYTPVMVSGVAKTFCHIEASGDYSLAVDYNGKTWAWGFNSYGTGVDVFNTRTPIQINL